MRAQTSASRAGVRRGRERGGHGCGPAGRDRTIVSAKSRTHARAPRGMASCTAWDRRWLGGPRKLAVAQSPHGHAHRPDASRKCILYLLYCRITVRLCNVVLDYSDRCTAVSRAGRAVLSAVLSWRVVAYRSPAAGGNRRAWSHPRHNMLTVHSLATPVCRPRAFGYA